MRVFISYKRGVEPDDGAADRIAEEVMRRGHHAFIDKRIPIGVAFPSAIESELASADALVVLLSAASAASEMVIQEVATAHQRSKREGHPIILPIRVRYRGDLPYDLGAMLNRLQQGTWEAEGDERRIVDDLCSGREGARRGSEAPPAKPLTLSVDGLAGEAHGELPVPLPAFDPQWLSRLEPPGGAMRLDSPFYVERQADGLVRALIVAEGHTVLVKGSRQVGKTSLLARLYQASRDSKKRVLFVDCQRIDEEAIASLDRFLLHLAHLMSEALGTKRPPAKWQGPLGAKDRLTAYVTKEVLGSAAGPFVLIMDEVDRLFARPFSSDFFGLLRSWHNQRAFDEPWQRFSLILGYSTEAFLFIQDLNQSPFNVGEQFELQDFDADQAHSLNERHGRPLSSSAVSELMGLLSGHPFLVRRSYYEVVRNKRNFGDLLDHAADDDGPFADHLHRYASQLAPQEELLQALRAVILEHQCPTERAFYRLRSAGLVRGHARSAVKPRCELYRRYFAERL
jgi:hypothetical protein